MSYSQEEIIPFNNNWTISLSINYHFIRFDQEDLFGCRGNKPLDMGMGIRYKKIALNFHIELPFSAEFYNPTSDSFDLNFDYIGENFIVNSYFSRYHSFFINNHQITEILSVSEVDLDILSTGLSFRWVLNPKTHSLQGVYKLDRKQTISSGSPILGFGIYYHSIYSADEKLPGYETKQHFIYTGPLAGFSYTWLFGGGMFFNTNIVGGINPGLNSDEMKFVFIPSLFPDITLGLNYKTWSFTASLDLKLFLTLQSYQINSAGWNNLSKFNITLFKITKRF